VCGVQVGELDGHHDPGPGLLDHLRLLAVNDEAAREGFQGRVDLLQVLGDLVVEVDRAQVGYGVSGHGENLRPASG
jgi:hypothetical protein